MPRTYVGASQTVGASTTSATVWTDCAVLSFTPDASATYYFLWSVAIGGDVITTDVQYRVFDGTTAFDTGNIECKDTVPPEYHSQGGMFRIVFGASPAAQNIRVQIKSETAGNNVRGRDAEIIAIKGVATDQYIETAGDAAPGSGLVTVQTLTWTPPSVKDYILIGSANVLVNATTTGMKLMLYDAAGAVASNNYMSSSDATTRRTCLVIDYEPALSATSKSFTLRTTTTATANSCTNRRLLALDVTGDSVFYDERRAGSSSTSASYVDSASFTFTAAQNVEHLAIGIGSITANSATVSGYGNLMLDGVQIDEHVAEWAATASPDNVMGHTGIIVQTLATGSRIIKSQVKAETAGSSFAAADTTFLVWQIAAPEPARTTATQTGTTLTFPNMGLGNTGTVSTAITVPSDADLIVVGWSGSPPSAGYFSGGQMTFTKSGVDTAMVCPETTADTATNFQSGPVFYLASPDRGTNKTLKWDWAGSAAALISSLCTITFWKNVDTASPIRDSVGIRTNNAPCATGPLLSLNGDRVLCFAAGYDNNAGLEGNVTAWTGGLTTLENTTHYQNSDAAWATAVATGNIASVGISTVDSNWFDSSAVTLAIKGALAPTDITGTMGIVETVDVLAATGAVNWQANLAVSETADALVFNGAVRWAATLATTEAGDTAAGTGTVQWAATLAAPETADVAALTGSVSWVATLAASETGDTAAFTGAVLIPLTGTLSVIETPDGAGLTGSVAWSATLAVTEAADVAALAAAVRWAATLAAIETGDTAALTGTTQWVATLAAPETADVAAMIATSRWLATLAAPETADVAALTGTVRWVATLAAPEAGDAASFTGGIYASGPLVVSEAPDTAAFTATAVTLGTLAATETGDVAAFTGGIYGTGTLAVTETADSFSAIGGVVGAGLIGTLAVTEMSDGAVFAATLSGNAGPFAATESADIAAATGAVKWAAVLAASEAPDTAAFTGTAKTLGTLAIAEAGDVAAFTAAVISAGGLVALEAPDTAALIGSVGWRVTLSVSEAADVAAFSGAIVNAGVLNVSEAPDLVAFQINAHTEAILAASEAPDRALFTSRPPDIQEAPGSILRNDHHRVRDLAAGTQRIRTLKYPIPRPREMLNTYDRRIRALDAGRRVRALTGG